MPLEEYDEEPGLGIRVPKVNGYFSSLLERRL
jgi:hypothetical protein